MASPTPSPTASSPPPPAATPPTSSPSPPPPPLSFSASTSFSGISTGAVSGIAIAGVAVLVSLCLIFIFCRKKRRRSNDRSVRPPPPGYNTAEIPNSEDVTTSDNGASSSTAVAIPNSEDATTGDNGASSSTAVAIPNSEDVTTGGNGASSSPGSTYEVFLSFRGPDTRLKFTDHLYTSLVREGVQTFRDDEKLRKGEEIRPGLMEAIEESSISIPIFSKGYASSKYCLMELTHMVKRMNERDPEGRRRHTVCPIFYDVTPEVVKRQTESFAEAFLQHEKEFGVQKVQEWKDALEKVGRLSGWEIANRHEAELIKEIVTEVCEKLKKRNVSLTDDLVGMDHHIEEMTKLLDNDGNGVRIVGIVGMGGIGKTTIAKFMYNKLCDQFQPQCGFLEDVRERVKRNGYVEFRKLLISEVLKRSVDGITIDKNTFRDKKVLIVFDDVEDKSQLKNIIGGCESQLASHNYFGSGSTIIVTTRNKEVFEELDGDLIYEPSGMDPDDSLFLFCKHAFRSTQPLEGYEEISREVVQTAAGLPLSLVVIGSMLFQKKRKDWVATLEKLKTIPANDVQKRLKISYDALTHNQQQMFLDIACHFIGKDKTHVIYMWEACGFFPEGCEGIDVLVSQSLIIIEELRDEYTTGREWDTDVFRMHDHLRDLGRDIVKQENQSHPGKRSRLWSDEESQEVLDNQSGTEKVEIFSMNYGWKSDYIISKDDLKGLSSLRYLYLEGVRLKGDFKGLVSDLRWFRWRFKDSNDALHNFGCCGSGFWKSRMPITNFCANKLVVLDLSESEIRDGWESWIQIKAATNLKVLKLSSCFSITKLPECLWNMKSLVELDLSDTGIAELPEQSIENLTNLTKLLLYESSIKRLPDAIGKLKKLELLDLKHTRIAELPEQGIGNLTNLTQLLLSNSMIYRLPDSIGKLKKLELLDLSCTGIAELPEQGIGNLTNLTKLLLNFSSIKMLPDAIGKLKKLEVLDLKHTLLEQIRDPIASKRVAKSLSF